MHREWRGKGFFIAGTELVFVNLSLLVWWMNLLQYLCYLLYCCFGQEFGEVLVHAPE